MANKDTKSSKDKKNGFRDFKAELKKVIWPTKEELMKNTVAVVTIVLLTALIVFVLDIAFESLNKYGISKLQTVYSDNFSESDETESDETVENESDENSTEQEENENNDTTQEDNASSEQEINVEDETNNVEDESNSEEVQEGQSEESNE